MPELSDVLQDAIKLEQDGERYYEMAAAKAANPLAKNTFAALAEQERAHADLLRAYCDAVDEGGTCPTPAAIDERDYSLGATARRIFEQAVADLAGGAVPAEDLHELYETAMQMERMSIELYRQQGDAATDPHAAEFFAYLVEQERGHLKLLADGQQYLEDPDSWYFEEEQWGVTG